MKRLFALALCFALIIPQALAVGTADWPAWGQEALDWARGSIHQRGVSLRAGADRDPGGCGAAPL